jgi:hypothetical protein
LTSHNSRSVDATVKAAFAAFFVTAIAGAPRSFLLQRRIGAWGARGSKAMKHFTFGLIAATLAFAATSMLLPAPAQAESLRMKVHQEQRYNMPKRGMTMDQVKREYGAPLKVLATRGGSSKHQPPIHRWEYSKYIVYFEYSHVIHSVLRTPGPDSL